MFSIFDNSEGRDIFKNLHRIEKVGNYWDKIYLTNILVNYDSYNVIDNKFNVF